MKRAHAPDLAAQLFAKHPERALALARAAWPIAVGPELARRTEVVSLDGAVLRVKVPDASWQRGLVKMRAEILRRLREIAGSAAPRSLGFVLGHVAPAPPAATPPAPAAPAPEAPQPLVLAAESLIPDLETRERFLEVAARYLARFGER